MGVKLLGKLKIYELAKKLDKTSKEILEVAKKLNIDVKNHLSSIEEKDALAIEKSFSSSTTSETKKTIKNIEEKTSESKSEEKPNNKKEKKEDKNQSPVIIRRELIIAEDDAKVKNEKIKKQEERKSQVGFVQRRSNQDYNIVYRNKATKPLTVSELFGIKKDTPKEVNKEQVKTNVEQEKVDANKINENQKIVEEKMDVKKDNTLIQNRDNLRNEIRTRNNYDKRDFRSNNYDNNKNMNRDSRFENRRNNFNNQENGFRTNRDNNFRTNRDNSFRSNNDKFSNNKFGRKPLDEKGIEKNIKNIISSDIVEKENVREYKNKVIDKQKNNSKYDENKAVKKNKAKKSIREDINEGKLKGLKQESRLSHMFNDQEGGMLDYYDLSTSRARKNKKKNVKGDEEKHESKQKIFKLTEVTIPETMTVKDFAAEIKKTTAEVIKKLLGYGILATINNEIDFDTAFLIAQEFGITAIKKEVVKEEDILFDDSEDDEKDLVPRPPVIVVMGHVDHGKTSLLDAIRQTNVIEGEAGGITQHIGAYKVEVNGREITFLDTPGHEAFTSMRARGAQVTDIAILVVAANDGVMPQTVEAINHAKAAGIPIIVAINKIDVEGANVEKVKQDLMQYELVPEEWGGDTIFVPISAKKKINIDTLLEMVLLVADMKELKANPNKQSKGVVIEARLDKTKGTIVTALVQRGTLDVGDTIVVGSVIGRVRAMTNEKGKKVKKAGPSTPVEIVGLTEVPEVGETFYEVKDEKTAKHLIERRKAQAREKSINATSRVTLNDLFNQIEKGKLKVLNLIVKADVQGSVEAVKQSLEKLSNDEVKVKVIHANVGGVTETDVTLAKVSNAIIIAFNVRPEPLAKEMADKEEVEIKQYSIIYKAIEDVESAMKGMLDPKFEEKVIGTAVIRQTFKVSNVGTIAGCYVTDGKVSRNAGIRVIRDNVVIHDGKLVSLKRFKDDVKEVATGYECGVQIDKFDDLLEGDTLEVYVMEQIK